MRAVVYSMSTSLDGYIVGPDGGFTWSTPDEEVFRLATDEVRGVGAHLMGRKLYETMIYWDTAEQDSSLNDAEREFAAIWKSLDKVVFSQTLTAVEGENTRLASGGIADEIARLRQVPGNGEIAIGGGELAAEVAALGLIDEYRMRTYPVLVGGGTPFFARASRHVELELLENGTLGSNVAYARYRVIR